MVVTKAQNQRVSIPHTQHSILTLHSVYIFSKVCVGLPSNSLCPRDCDVVAKLRTMQPHH